MLKTDASSTERRAGARWQALWVAATLVAIMFAITPDALAYTVYRTDGNRDIPLRWFSENVEYMVSEITAPGIETPALITLSQQGMGAWQDASNCSPTLSFSGTTTDTEGSFTVGCVNTNVIVFISDKNDWAQKGFSKLEIAKTTLMFSEANGEIVDADIEINAGEYTFSSGEPVPGSIDLLNTLTHEAGHFLGMDHSVHNEATMYAQAPPEETKKRSLEQDDIEGACFLYEGFSPANIDAVSYYDDACNPQTEPQDTTPPADTDLPVVRNSGCASTPFNNNPAPYMLLYLMMISAIVSGRRTAA